MYLGSNPLSFAVTSINVQSYYGIESAFASFLPISLPPLPYCLEIVIIFPIIIPPFVLYSYACCTCAEDSSCLSYIFDMTFDISIPSILCLAVDFRGKVATYISTASHVNYNVAINAAVNECLVGHRIYETNPRIGEKEYNSDYDVVEMYDHVNHASRREYIKNYDFLFESEVKTVEELYGSESYKISDSIDDAKDFLDFIRDIQQRSM